MKISNGYMMYRILNATKELVLDVYPGKASLREFFILQHISFNSTGCTQYELTKAMNLSSARINAAVKKLHTDGMVHIAEINDGSARVKKNVTVTDEGQQTVNAYLVASQQYFKTALSKHGNDEQAQQQKLDHLHQALSALFEIID